MSTNQLNMRDQQVVAELQKLSDGTTAGERFARALELGATPVLLARIATGYTQTGPDGFAVTDLPYVEQLLAAGWSADKVQEFLQDQCFNESEYDTCSLHREGFWNNYDLWHLFDGDSDAFVKFMKEFAATYDGSRRILTQTGHDALEAYLGPWRHTTQDCQRDVHSIEEVAASHLTHIENEYQLDLMIHYATGGRGRDIGKKVATRAYKVGHWGWNVVFRGYAFAKLQSYTYEHNLLWGELDQALRTRPAWGRALYRWLAEGYWRDSDRFWDMRIERSNLPSLFDTHGWYFARVTETQNGKLKASFTVKGERITVWHVPGEEPLQADDPVMIHREDFKGKTPRFQPGGKAYDLTLTPARRPTPEQLADVRGQFPTR